MDEGGGDGGGGEEGVVVPALRDGLQHFCSLGIGIGFFLFSVS